jgi:hypothetical protein
MSYRESAAFRASRAKTARKRYWRDPEKARQRARLSEKKSPQAGARAMTDLRGMLPESWYCIDCGINTAAAMTTLPPYPRCGVESSDLHTFTECTVAC